MLTSAYTAEKKTGASPGSSGETGERGEMGGEEGDAIGEAKSGQINAPVQIS